jgi:hypothetical protein
LRIVVSLIVLCGFLFSTGCRANSVDGGEPLEVTSSPVPAPPSTSPPVSPTDGDATQMVQPLPTSSKLGLQVLIEKTQEDLAQRLSVPITQITLDEATEVEWSDSSLDCPQPGMEYLQVITPGYRIVLQVNNQSYEYHTNRDAYFVYCDN